MSRTFHPLVAQKLREARIHVGKSQDDVADHLHITQQNYSRYELNTGIPTRYLIKACKYLGIQIHEVFSLYDTETTPVGIEGG